MNEVDERVRKQIRQTPPDPDTPAYWPMPLRKAISAAKRVDVMVLWGPDDDPHDVWMRLNVALAERAEQCSKPQEYFVTFTVPTTEEHLDPKRVLSRACTFSKRYAAQISWGLELTKEGYPHVHMLVKPIPTYAKNLCAKRKQIRAINNDYCMGKDWLMKARSHKAVEAYIQKFETKPDEAYLTKWGLSKYKGDMLDLESLF